MRQAEAKQAAHRRSTRHQVAPRECRTCHAVPESQAPVAHAFWHSRIRTQLRTWHLRVLALNAPGSSRDLRRARDNAGVVSPCGARSGRARTALLKTRRLLPAGFGYGRCSDIRSRRILLREEFRFPPERVQLSIL